jgi:hypothetical protein
MPLTLQPECQGRPESGPGPNLTCVAAEAAPLAMGNAAAASPTSEALVAPARNPLREEDMMFMIVHRSWFSWPVERMSTSIPTLRLSWRNLRAKFRQLTIGCQLQQD